MSTKNKIELIKPQRLPLTPEKLRELSGLDLSDEQAEDVIWSLTRFARVICDFTIQQEQSPECQNNSELG
jgi:hypothetical protein